MGFDKKIVRGAEQEQEIMDEKLLILRWRRQDVDVAEIGAGKFYR